MSGNTTTTTRDEWAVRQRGLDGEPARGQATLDGDVVAPDEHRRRRLLEAQDSQDLDDEAAKEVVLDYKTYCETQRALLELDEDSSEDDDRYATALEAIVAAWNNGTRTEESDA